MTTRRFTRQGLAAKLRFPSFQVVRTGLFPSAAARTLNTHVRGDRISRRPRRAGTGLQEPAHGQDRRLDHRADPPPRPAQPGRNRRPGWLSELWDTVTEISFGYIVLGCLFQGLQTVLTALGWYGILRYAYPGGVTFMPVLASYAAGVALNNFLPANIGTFVTLLMYVAIVRGSTFPGVLAGYVVQKIFYFIIGTLDLHLPVLGRGGLVRLPLRKRERCDHEPRRAHARHHRRRDLPARPARANLLGLGQEDVGTGKEGRGDPRRPPRIPEARADPADWRLRGEGDGDHRLPRGLQHPGHVRLGDERARLEPAREHPLVHARRRRHQPGVQLVRPRQLHGLDDRDRLFDLAAADHDGVQRRLRGHADLRRVRLERRVAARPRPPIPARR